MLCVGSGAAEKCATPHKLLLGEGRGVNYSSHTGTAEPGPRRGAGPFITERATAGADIYGELAGTRLEKTGLEG